MSANSAIKRAFIGLLVFAGALSNPTSPAIAITPHRTAGYGTDGAVTRALGTASVSLHARAAGTAYWVVTRDGGVASGGGAPDLGGLSRSARLTSPVVGMAAIADGDGYWLVSSAGAVYSFGDAKYYGSVGGTRLLGTAGVVVGIAATKDGHGYWLASGTGGVYSFGDARFYGSVRVPAASIVAIAGDPKGGGYWLISATGRVFSFGDATYRGSAPPGHSIVGFAATRDGRGYFLATQKGGVISFGDAHPRGSALGRGSPSPFVGIAAERDGNGYWFANTRGTTFGFGSAAATAAPDLARGAIAIVADPTVAVPRPAVLASAGALLRNAANDSVQLPERNGQIAVEFALGQVGKPYIWGGTGPYGFDCSGLALAAWAAAGVQLPRVAAAQYWSGPHVPLSEVEPGDLIFWASDPADPSTIYHVAISLGGDRTVQATHSGSYVQVMGLWADGLVPLATVP
jgi:cell wall-associated NlpC family hydrolase